MKKEMRLKILTELRKKPYQNPYQLSKKITNSPSGIKRYLKTLELLGIVESIKIEENNKIQIKYFLV